ncbi:WXG100-like domain-containing protein [Sphaerisporangium corydalis]|uniref:Outer membrane channel protein CpnT-like N-terminal domain-containing protein n=1 Tax=Sphaerisporangium corydalis TaxID=1441875 RepID=A0ABV9E6T9_9ACTN|nr:hypothetical protein [Sphaerisporangium corydalis]
MTPPLAGFTKLVKAHPVGTTMGVGMVTHAAFASAILMVDWPEGDPDKLRQAATIMNDLAGKIDSGLVAANDAAVQVWLKNSGLGIDAFKKMWAGGGGTYGPFVTTPPEGFSGYPPDVAGLCRRIAKACEGYAECVETTRKILIVLAIQSYTNMLFTSMWGWSSAGLSTMVQKKIIEKYFQRLAQSRLKLLGLSVEKLVHSFFYYSIESAAYAGGQQAIRLGVYGASGVRTDDKGRDVFSFGTNGTQFLQGAAANAAYNTVWDAIPVTRFTPKGTRWGDFVRRLSGSATYSVTDNFLQNPDGQPFPTDWQTWTSKILTHGVRSIRPS